MSINLPTNNIVIISCKKEYASVDNHLLSFSTDTLLFDTIFTTVGSATRYLKIYNNHDQNVVINSIHLEKMHNSSFRINIDGEANHSVENILLRSNDSLYIFAEVTIDPNNLNIPIIETDAINLIYNEKIQKNDLVAWGRDAYFHSGIPDYHQHNPFSSNLDSMLYSDFFNLTIIPDALIGQYFYYYSS